MESIEPEELILDRLLALFIGAAPTEPEELVRCLGSVLPLDVAEPVESFLRLLLPVAAGESRSDSDSVIDNRDEPLGEDSLSFA